MNLRRHLVALRDDDGFAALFGRLAEDGKTLVHAEIAVVKARTIGRIAAYRTAIALFAAAGVLALCALIALLVGLEIALAAVLGMFVATLVVVGIVLVVAIVLAVVGKSRLSPRGDETA